MTLSGNWNYPTAVKFGPGRIRELADICRGAGIRRPLLVTDSGLAKLPMIAAARRRSRASAIIGSLARPESVTRSG
ncbi:MAG TPA: hypothetical protein VM434_07335, partial [Beijerinckiaceae bacterium]|nr:hypothetical protein [Beijerinckiaceae bacterium]